MLNSIKASVRWVLRNANIHEYLIGRTLARRFNIQGLRHLFEGRTVCCVGSGPSIDAVDLSVVQSSTVMLLNHAINFREHFNATNSLVWFATDVYRIEQIIGSVPTEIPRIVMPHIYARTRIMRGSLLKGDAYIHITPDLSKAALLNSQRQRLPLLRPARKRLTQPVVGGGLNGHMDGILPGTVMLNAIALAVLLGANRIVTLGFDVPAASTAKEIGGGGYAKGVSPPHRSPGFYLDEVSLFFS